MNILKELKKAWDNAVKTKEEKDAASRESLEELKKDIESSGKTEIDKPKLPPAAEYEKIEHKEKTDEELNRLAENMYKEYGRTALEGIENDINSQRDKLDESRVNAEKAKEERLKEIDGEYETAKRNLDNDSLKRGLARSSIAVARTAGLEENRAADRLSASDAYSSAVQKLAERISELDVKGQNRKDSLEKELADKIAVKIDELRKEDKAAALDALKYNNSIEEKSAKDKTDRLKLEQQLESGALDNLKKKQELAGGKDAENNRYASNYNKMDELLSKMNRSDAAKLIKDDPFFRANLSDYLYYKLYSKYAG